MSTPVLSTAVIEQRLARLQSVPDRHQTVPEAMAERRHEGVQAVIAEARDRYKYVVPFAQAADNLIDYLVNTEGRFMFGLREIDVMMRGVGKGELCFITGFSHSGKTQLFLQAIVNNRQRPVVLFTLDEPSELVLAKLVGLRENWNFEWVESRIKAQDKDVLRRVREIAAIDFKNLVVVDDIIGLAQMADALKEAEDYVGQEIAAVGIDYLTVLPDGEDVEGKAQSLKRWTKEVDLPVICLHQGGKGTAGKGEPITMTSMLHGGHAEAIFIIGCRRKRDCEAMDDWDRQAHAHTISVSVVKNKRPPSKRGEYDYYLDPNSGIIRSIEAGDPGTYLETAVAPKALGPSMSNLLAAKAAARGGESNAG